MSYLNKSISAGKISVALGELASELERIHRESAELDKQMDIEEGREPAPRVHSRLCNLILLSSNGHDCVTQEYLDSLITEICVSYPSRFFIIEYHSEHYDEDLVSNGLCAHVSSRCVKTHAGSHVCSEEIYISADQESLPAIPNLLLSLLAPDVKTILVLLCDPAEDKLEYNCSKSKQECSSLICGLRGLSDFVLYDSSVFRCYQSGLSLLLRSNNGGSLEGVDIFDLAWLRAITFRKVITEQFDSTFLAEEWSNIERVYIDCIFKDSNEPSSDAIMLASWIICSMGWSLQKAKFSEVGDLEIQCTDIDSISKILVFKRRAFSCANGLLHACGVEFLFNTKVGVSSLSFSVRDVAEEGAVLFDVRGEGSFIGFSHVSMKLASNEHLVSHSLHVSLEHTDKAFIEALKTSIILATNVAQIPPRLTT